MGRRQSPDRPGATVTGASTFRRAFESAVVIDARALNEYYRHVPNTMDTVTRAEDVAEEGICTGSSDERSSFHNLSSQPESWPLLGVSHDDMNYVCSAFPFGWNVSPVCYLLLHLARQKRRPYVKVVFPFSPTSTTRATGTSPPRSGVLTRYNGCPPQTAFTWVYWSGLFSATSCPTPSTT